MKNNPTVFISYSHKDEVWKDRLVTHLNVLATQDILDVWDDQRISGGDDWFPEIEKAINASVTAILLITANFLTSNFILRTEIPRLLARREKEGMRVIPFIVKPCAWEDVDWLKKIQARPKDGRPLSGGSEFQIDGDLTSLTKEVSGFISRAAINSSSIPQYQLPPDKISVAKLPATGPELFGRDQELALLDSVWTDTHKHIICFSAMGGAGKTSLVKTWLNNMEKDNYRGAEQVYSWSFYSQGAEEGKQVSADEFISHALKSFGYDGPMDISVWEKGETLADLIRQQRTLLILDGLEPLQHPPGPMSGRLKDQGLECLLKNIAASNNGLCVITTRLFVGDLSDSKSTVIDIPLDRLSDEAGAQLLSAMDVKGTEEELRKASHEFKGHALALTLLGSYISAVYEGEIRKRDLIAKLTEDEEKGGHAKRVMESYVNWLAGKPELNILFLMGLFDRPAPSGAIKILRRKPVMKGLTEEIAKLSETNWKYAVKHLRDLHLLANADDKQPDILDCHPLVREYFGDRLKRKHSVSWKKAHGRLYEFFKNQAPELPETIEEMAPLFSAVAHGCAAGRHQEAFDDVYMKRIDRKEYFSVRKLCAFGSALACISHFFAKPWHTSITGLTEPVKALLLNSAGAYLLSLGRLAEAAEPLNAAMTWAVDKKDWGHASTAANNLSVLVLSMGKVSLAIEYAKNSMNYADKSKGGKAELSSRASLANALYQAGSIDEAERLFKEVEELQIKYRNLVPICSYNCDLLLEKGNYQAVLEGARQKLELSRQYQDPRGLALNDLFLGNAYLLKALKERFADYSESEKHLNKAVDGLRKAGIQEFIVRGLLSRAELYRIKKDYPKSKRDLDEAMTIATRGGMKLYEADCYLEYARLYFAEGDKEKTKEHVSTAKKMIEEMGYHRRDKDVKEIEQIL